MESLNEKILSVDLSDEVKKSFISYAMAVNISRALPDVCDGLKPVHRRILYAMNELGNTYDKPHKKCARIVGEVLGKYHPHGDSSVYDALVRLAQDFSIRMTLVDGQGNFGSVDGDGAAAMRYTEARLSKIANELLRDIDKDTVDFYPNFDGTLMQPKMLPSRFPNLLVNGSDGIAVGMATNIPPHNLREVIAGAVAMLDNPDITVQELMEYIPGPDFPTGAYILGKSGIYDAYTTGRGRIVERARTEIETLANGKSRIIVTAIPYQVNKSVMIKRIADLVKDKRVEGITDIRDETNREGMRVVIEIKKDVNPQIVLNTLYKHTQMQENFGVIMLALVDGQPRVLSLRDMLYYYLEYQKTIIVRRTRYDLDKAQARLHIIDGLLAALDQIDAVISVIRASADVNIAKAALMENFGLSDKQAAAILDMRLQRLTGLERSKLEAEDAELKKRVEYYNAVLGSDEMVRGIIKTELNEIADKYGDSRRTEIVPVSDEINMADLIEEHEVVVTMTHAGYIKRLPSDTYRSQRRGGRGIAGLTTRDEDYVEHIFTTSSHSDLLFFTNFGKAFSLKAYMIPEASRTAKGTAIVNLLQLSGGERISTGLVLPEEPTGYLMLGTKFGTVKKMDVQDFTNIRRNGLIAVSLVENDELIGAELTDGHDEIFLGTRNGMCIRFDENDVRSVGRTAQGVRGILLGEDDEVVSMSRIREDMQVLSVTENGFGKRSDMEDYRVQYRGGKGVIGHDVSAKTGRVAAFCMVDDSMDVMMITDTGTIIRTPIEDVRISGRNTQGVHMMRLADEIRIVAITTAPKAEESEEEDELLPDETGSATATEPLSEEPASAEDDSLARLLERAETPENE
ncbi:MAG: DNA gyrase subunit A [Eubacteriales bacterium]|nr:DNA gyrase subunit A [Eubacteriales bacterium]